MNGLSSKRKGNRFERELVDEACEIDGLDCERTWGSNGATRGLPEEVDVILYEGDRAEHVTVKHVQAKRSKTIPQYLTLEGELNAVRFTETSTGAVYYLLRYRAYLTLFAGGSLELRITEVSRKVVGNQYKPGFAVCGQAFRANHGAAHIMLTEQEFQRVYA